jgi:hypothetical protein
MLRNEEFEKTVIKLFRESGYKDMTHRERFLLVLASCESAEQMKSNYQIMLCVGLPDLIKLVHAYSRKDGFWSTNPDTEDLVVRIANELFFALEAEDSGKMANLDKYDKGIAYGDCFETYIKDTFEDKLADAFIRLLDLCGSRGIDLERFVNIKLEYNKRSIAKSKGNDG